MRIKISQLDPGVAAPDSVVPASNAAGTATEKVTLGDISRLALGDVTFDGVRVIGSGEDSGDGSGNGTLELVPDASLISSHQYLVVDPTSPGHIHLRAGGPQDGSNAELILGGEHAHVRVLDDGHQVAVRSASGDPLSDNDWTFGGDGVLALAGGGVRFADNTVQTTAVPINPPILALGTLSGSNALDFGSDRLFQTLTLAGSAVTFTKGAGWPATSVTADVILRITVTTATTITWTVVTDWFTQPPAGALNSGTHLFLLRAIGSSIIEGHYIGNKTN